MGKFSDIRTAHGQGLIDIAVSRDQDNTKLLTCGSDGSVYIWDKECFHNGKSMEISVVTDSPITCIVWQESDVYFGHSTEDLLTGNQQNSIGRMNFDNLAKAANNSNNAEIDQMLTFMLQATAVDASNNFLVAGASDHLVKLIKRGSSKMSLYERFEAEGEILSAKLDPTEKNISITCSDGSLVILDTTGLNKVCSFERVFPPGISSPANSRAICTWSREGDVLYVPSLGCVKLLKTASWSFGTPLNAPGYETLTFSTSTLSPCGNYLASSTLSSPTASSRILIWKLSDRSLVCNEEYKRSAKGTNTITALAFAPFDSKSLVVADANEGICILNNAITVAQPATAVLREELSANDSFEDEDKPIRNRFIRSEADESDTEVIEIEDEDTNMSSDIGAIKKKFGFSSEATGVLEDFGFERIEKDLPYDVQTGIQNNRDPATVTQIIDYDPPAIPTSFVSGSTHGVNQRYLKWNQYGMIRSFNRDDGDGSIEIEFHDSTIHSVIDMINSNDYTLGDLSDEVVALASSPDDSELQSELLVIHIGSWDSDSRRWNTKLPMKDVAVDLLVSRNIIAVITTLRNIRIFNLSGTQRQVITHPGSLITSCCFGYNIALATINGSEYYEERKKDGKKKRQYQYNLTVYNFDEKHWYTSQTVNTTSVPLAITPSNKLEWLSYSSGGQLCSMDSCYIVRWHSPGRLWVPIFDGFAEVKNKTDAIWPISVIDGKHRQIRYLHCKGTRHPQITSKLTPIIGDWALPLCQPDVEKTKLEEGLLFNELFQNLADQNNMASELAGLQADHLQTLVKLFALACKSDRSMRAFDISQLVSSSRGIQVMCNYAASTGKQVLAEKVAEVGRENVSAPPSKDNIIAPRRVSLPKKRVSQIPKIIEETPESEDDDSEMHAESTSTQEHDVSIMSEQQTQVPLQKFNRNPFKKSTDAGLNTSASGLDLLEASFDRTRKRTREDTTSEVPSTVKKQMKLSFGSASEKMSGKENSGATAYSLWLAENEDRIKKQFSGGLEDYDKFCINQYKLLSAAQKKEWKSKAESASQNVS